MIITTTVPAAATATTADVDTVIRYFNEVALDAEFSSGGNASLVQKWTAPIYYTILGEYTEKDIQVLTDFATWLNSLDGFPGIYPASSAAAVNLTIHFCNKATLISIMGQNFVESDGGVTFWYDDNQIYNATVCYRNDIAQDVQNSVILDEIYNGLGPVQDTRERDDSIIYAGYSIPQSLTDTDKLNLALLYHPDIQCGMDTWQCAEIIRELYS